MTGRFRPDSKWTAAVSVVWGVVLGGTFACVLPWALGEWHLPRPLPYRQAAQVAGGMLIVAGTVPIVQSFVEFVRAGGTPAPPLSPPRLVLSGFYRYVRNPIYVGYLGVMLGETLLFFSAGLLVYTASSWCIASLAVRFYEEPVLERRFKDHYRCYRRHVRAWIPRLHPWTPEPGRRPGA